MSVSKYTPTIFPIRKWYLSISQSWGPPCGPVVKNLPFNERDADLISVWGIKILHASGQVSLSSATREAHMPHYWALAPKDDPTQPKEKKVNPDFAHVTYYLTFSHNLLLYISSWTSSSLEWRCRREILIRRFFFNQKEQNNLRKTVIQK